MATSTITIISGASTVTLDNTVSTITLGTSGPQGAPGEGVPVGGTAGQILAKDTATDYDTSWIDNYTTDVRKWVKNDSGGTLAKGTVVYVSGANGTNVLVKPALATTDGTSATTIGFLNESLANNGQGYAIVEGTISGIDTSTATAGDPVWLSGSVAGGVLYGVANKPQAPVHIVYLGTVTRAHATQGSIEISVNNGWELDELHNVKITSPANGQVLTYDSAQSLWVNSSETGDISAVNVTSPITGGGTSGAVTIGIDQTALAIAPSQVTGTAVITTDPRLSDARTPTAHASTHAAAGSDPVTLAQSQVTNLTTDLAAKTPITRTISTTAPLSGGGDLSANRTLTIADATTSVKGAVQLTDSVASTSLTTAATPNSVKTAYDLAAAATPTTVLQNWAYSPYPETVPRWVVTGAATPVNGRNYLISFVPTSNITVSQISVICGTGGTDIGGTTVRRLGLYTISGSTYTLVARSAADSTLFTANSTIYTRSFNTTGGYPATYALTAGTMYAVGIIQYNTGGTFLGGTLLNHPGVSFALQSLNPRFSAFADSQTDLSNISSASGLGSVIYARVS